MENLVTKLGKSENMFMFGMNGMENLERVHLAKGCRLVAFGGAGYIGSEGVDYVIHDDKMNAVRVFYGKDPNEVEDYETEMYFSPYHHVDEHTRPLSQKFGIGFYYVEERLDDAVIERSIAHADRIVARGEEIKEEKRIAAEKLREKLLKEYSYLERVPDNDYKAARKITGDNIRKELKKNFPNVKFSVRHSSFSGGGDYTVRWENGPMQDVVDAVVKKFQDSHSDFTGDYWDYDPSEFNKLFGGEKFIMVSRDASADFADKVLAKYEGLTAENWKTYAGFPDGFSRGWMFEEWRNPTFEDCLERLFHYTDLTPTAEVLTEAVNEIKKSIEFIDYSEKAFAVVGDTKSIKDLLKSLGGRFNPRLSCGAGWIFSKKKREEVETALA